ncbi:MAG: nucleotidyl transferase AbiEii/AbiGii toxin family protein [Nanoarchaeota archaeon]
MDTLKKITPEHFEQVRADRPFNKVLLMKDYHITVLLYLMKDIEGICFKGGTALGKIILNYHRMSEDIDFTLTKDLELVKKDIINAIEKSGFFDKITKDKDVQGFTRLIVHYKGFDDEEGTVFIDLNQRGKLLLPPEKHAVKHFYPDEIPAFNFPTLAQEEMIAEKVVAAINRNKPRDHFDIYMIIKKGLPINKELVKKKCVESGTLFDITKMFNQGQKLHKRWNEDMLPLLAEEVSFQEVMGTVARYFKLKEEKEKKKTIIKDL